MADIRFEYTPLEIHRPFHACSADFACMFGAVGSGKSYALVSECIAACLEQPGLLAVLGRLHATDLRDSTESIFMDILPSELFTAGKAARVNNHFESFVFPNGSKVLFRGFEDWEKQKSVNYGWIGVDEAGQLNEDIFHGLTTRLRQTIALAGAIKLGYPRAISRRHMRLATNPAGKDWIYDLFVNEQKKIPGSEWFRSTSFDNPFLPSDFLNRIMNFPDRWVRRYVLCQFDDFGGAIYPEWTWGTHVVPVKREWPDGTEFYQAVDPGMSQVNPFASIWLALDRVNRRLVAIREYQEDGLSIRDHARNWRRIEAELRIPRVSWRVADPTIDTREQATGMTRHDIFRREGFSFHLGPKGHDIRVPALGELIATRSFIAQENCPQLHEQITKYRWVDLTPLQKSRGQEQSERVRKGNDHLVDCAQYASSRYRAPLRAKAIERDLTPAQEFSEEVKGMIRQQIRGRRRRRPAAPGTIH